MFASLPRPDTRQIIATAPSVTIPLIYKSPDTAWLSYPSPWADAYNMPWADPIVLPGTTTQEDTSLFDSFCRRFMALVWALEFHRSDTGNSSMAPPFDIQLPYMRDVVTLDFAVEWLRLRWQTHVHILTNTSPPSDSFAAPTGFYADWAPGSTTVMWAWFDSPTDTGTPRYVGWKWYWFGGDTPAPGTTGAEEGAAVILASTVGAEPQINDPSGYQSNEAVGLYEGWCGPYALNTWWAGPPPAGAKGVAVGCFYCLSFDEDSNTFVGEGLHSIWVLPVSTGEGEDT